MATENKEILDFQEAIDTRMQYGAPELKRNFKKFASRGLIFAIVIHAFLIGSYIVTLYIEQVQLERQLQIKRDIELKDIQTQDAKEEDNAPPPPDIPVQETVQLKDLQALTPEPVKSKDAEIQTIKDVEKMEKTNDAVSKEGVDQLLPGQTLGKKVNDVVVEKKEAKEEKKEKTTKTFQQFEVDKPPVAVNLASVKSSMRYPEIAKSNGIEGKVTVKVLVGPDGSVVQVGGFSGPDVFRDEVSSKVMSLQFTPALQQGQAVRCWVSVPFSFTLTGKFKKESGDEDKKEEKKKEGDK